MTERPAAASRLLSLDAFRGLTIAAMILVNNPGDWGHVYWPLLHVPWHGWTPTDLIFPFFLFMVGMSLTFSRRTDARPAVARALKLVGLGLLLNLYPYFPVAELRWPGVLQRIGLCYLAAWAAKRWLAPRGQAVLTAALVVGYWAIMTRVAGPGGLPPSLEPQTNLSARLDQVLLVPHVWSVTKTWDPEGVLSTLPAIATTVLGVIFFLLINKTKVGLAIRAVAINAEAGKLMGINSGMIVTLIFVIAGILAGVSGVFLGVQYSVYPAVGSIMMLKGFIASVIGGLGSLSGAIFAALALGIIEMFLTYFLGARETTVIMFAIMLAFLFIRPQGISGKITEDKV